MSRFIIVCLLFSTFSALGQRFSSELWHQGFLVTTAQDTIRGKVKYDMETNIVLVSRNNVVQSYSSQKIFYFEIFDQLLDNYRQFYAVPYEVRSDYEVPIIFEVLYEGPLSLLAREFVTVQTVNANAAYYAPITQNVLSQTYYFVDKSGKIDMYSGRKQELYQIFIKKQAQVKEFIRKNKLDVNDPGDLIRITAFYNSI